MRLSGASLPAWPTESLFSLSWRLAQANCCPQLTIARLLAQKWGAEVTLTRAQSDELDLERFEQMGSAPVRLLQAGLAETYPLGTGPWMEIGLTVCPQCLRQGFHSALLQLGFFERCPVHDIRLETHQQSYVYGKSVKQFGEHTPMCELWNAHPAHRQETPLQPMVRPPDEASVWAEVLDQITRERCNFRTVACKVGRAGDGIHFSPVLLHFLLFGRERAGPPKSWAEALDQIKGLTSGDFKGTSKAGDDDHMEAALPVFRSVLRRHWRRTLGTHRACVLAIMRASSECWRGHDQGLLEVARDYCPVAYGFLAQLYARRPHVWRGRRQNDHGAILRRITREDLEHWVRQLPADCKTCPEASLRAVAMNTALELELSRPAASVFVVPRPLVDLKLENWTKPFERQIWRCEGRDVIDSDQHKPVRGWELAENPETGMMRLRMAVRLLPALDRDERPPGVLRMKISERDCPPPRDRRHATALARAIEIYCEPKGNDDYFFARLYRLRANAM